MAGSVASRAAGLCLRLFVCGALLTSLASAEPSPALEAADWATQLASEDLDRRRASIHALADLGGIEAVELLSMRLEHEADDAMRRAIHDGLMRVQLDADQLATVLTDSDISAARAFAAHSLGHHRSPGAVANLLASIRDPEPTVRREIYEALGGSGDRTLIQELIKAAVRETSPSLREQAELAAQQLAAESGRPREVLVAISMLQGGNVDDQIWAIEVLSESKDWRALQVLLDTAAHAAPEIRREAIKALGILGDHRAVPTLLDMLERSTGRTRHHVIGALALLRDESSIEALGVLVTDDDPATRVLAIRALSALDHPRVVSRIIPALTDAEEPIRIEAIHALGRNGSDQALSALHTSLTDPSPFLRAEATRLLAMSGDPSVEPALLEVLGDGDPLVRLTAAEGLARMGSESALPLLLVLAERTRNDDERAAYDKAIERLRGSEISP